jgi:hypothetical protein
MDHCIKTVSGSVDETITIEDRVWNMQLMVSDFLSIASGLVERVPQELNKDELKKRIKWLKMNQSKIFEASKDIRQLEVGPYFDARQLQIPPSDVPVNQIANYQSYSLNTTEELFTVTHDLCKDLLTQWEQCVGAECSVQASEVDTILPGFSNFQDALAAIEFSKTRKLYTHNISLLGSKLKQNIEIPARTHKGWIWLNTDLISGKMYIKVLFQGAVEYGWRIMGGPPSTYDRFVEAALYLYLGFTLAGVTQEELPHLQRYILSATITAEAVLDFGAIKPSRRDLIFKQTAQTLFNMVWSTMPEDYVSEDKKSTSRSDPQSVGTLEAIVTRLATLPGNPDVLALLNALDKEFFLQFPNYNSQFMDLYAQKKNHVQLLKVIQCTLQSAASSRRDELIHHQVPRTREPIKDALGHLHTILKDPTISQEAHDLLQLGMHDPMLIEHQPELFGELVSFSLEFMDSKELVDLAAAYMAAGDLTLARPVGELLLRLQQSVEEVGTRFKQFLSIPGWPEEAFTETLRLMKATGIAEPEVQRRCVDRLVIYKKYLPTVSIEADAHKQGFQIIDIALAYLDVLTPDNVSVLCKSLLSHNLLAHFASHAWPLFAKVQKFSHLTTLYKSWSSMEHTENFKKLFPKAIKEMKQEDRLAFIDAIDKGACIFQPNLYVSLCIASDVEQIKLQPDQFLVLAKSLDKVQLVDFELQPKLIRIFAFYVINHLRESVPVLDIILSHYSRVFITIDNKALIDLVGSFIQENAIDELTEILLAIACQRRAFGALVSIEKVINKCDDLWKELEGLLKAQPKLCHIVADKIKEEEDHIFKRYKKQLKEWLKSV